MFKKLQKNSFYFVLFILLAALFVGRMIAVTGASMDSVALKVNGGKMPIDLDKLPLELQKKLLPDGRHKAMDSETRVPFLCDWIPVYSGAMNVLAEGIRRRNGALLAPIELINMHRYIRPLIASPGDIAVYLGFWTMFFAYNAVWILLFLQLTRWLLRKFRQGRK